MSDVRIRKTGLTRDNRIDWPRNPGFDEGTIQGETPFVLLTQEASKMRLCSQAEKTYNKLDLIFSLDCNLFVVMNVFDCA